MKKLAPSFLFLSVFAAGIFSSLFSPQSFAYPNFIGYGYTSCMVCHFNSFGGGPLTDYGRALGAVAVSSKPFWNSKASDEKLGEEAQFFFGPNPDVLKNIRFQANYRGLTYISKLNRSEERQSRYINMVGDLSTVYVGEQNRLIGVVNLGFIPPPQGNTDKLSSQKKSRIITREHYVSYPVMKKLRAYLGLMDIAYGIRHPDHISASRQYPGTSMNDQTHGVALHLANKSSEFGLQGFVGNLLEPLSSIRQKGASATFEFDVLEKFRLGSSLLYSKSTVRSRMAGAVHGRLGLGKGSALLGEIGLVKTTLIDEDPLYASYIWGQSTVRTIRGLHVLFTAEASTRDTFHPGTRSLMAGPSLQYFPFSRLELRTDLWIYRSFGDPSGAPADDFRLNGQVHLWF